MEGFEERIALLWQFISRMPLVLFASKSAYVVIPLGKPPALPGDSPEFDRGLFVLLGAKTIIIQKFGIRNGT